MDLNTTREDLERQLNVINELIAKKQYIDDNIMAIGLNRTSDEEFLNSIVDYIQNNKNGNMKQNIVILYKHLKDYVKNIINVDNYGRELAFFCQEGKITNDINSCVYAYQL